MRGRYGNFTGKRWHSNPNSYHNYRRSNRSNNGSDNGSVGHKSYDIPPRRKREIFMEAGRLAAEYLVYKGLLPLDSLVSVEKNNAYIHSDDCEDDDRRGKKRMEVDSGREHGRFGKRNRVCPDMDKECEIDRGYGRERQRGFDRGYNDMEEEGEFDRGRNRERRRVYNDMEEEGEFNCGYGRERRSRLGRGYNDMEEEDDFVDRRYSRERRRGFGKGYRDMDEGELDCGYDREMRRGSVKGDFDRRNDRERQRGFGRGCNDREEEDDFDPGYGRERQRRFGRDYIDVEEEDDFDRGYDGERQRRFDRRCNDMEEEDDFHSGNDRERGRRLGRFSSRSEVCRQSNKVSPKMTKNEVHDRVVADNGEVTDLEIAVKSDTSGDSKKENGRKEADVQPSELCRFARVPSKPLLSLIAQKGTQMDEGVINEGSNTVESSYGKTKAAKGKDLVMGSSKGSLVNQADTGKDDMGKEAVDKSVERQQEATRSPPASQSFNSVVIKEEKSIEKQSSPRIERPQMDEETIEPGEVDEGIIIEAGNVLESFSGEMKVTKGEDLVMGSSNGSLTDQANVEKESAAESIDRQQEARQGRPGWELCNTRVTEAENLREKQSTEGVERPQMDEEMHEAGEIGEKKPVDNAFIPKTEPELDARLEDEEQILSDVVEFSEVAEILNDSVPDHFQTSASSLETGKEASLDFGLSIGDNNKNVDENYSPLASTHNVVQVTDLKDDSVDGLTYDPSNPKKEPMHPNSDSFLNQAGNGDLPGFHDSHSFLICENLESDTPCEAVPSDLNDLESGMGIHEAEGVPNDDDSVYALGERPTGFMEV